MAITTLISSGTSAIRLAIVVDEIRNEIKNVYTDISSAEFTSAQQAFRAAESSSNPSDEIRNAIAHLRVSYNIIDGLLNKKVTSRFLFWSSEEDLLAGNSNKAPVYLVQCQLATLIAISYSMLNEYFNARDWKKEVLNCFDQYAKKAIIYKQGEDEYCDENGHIHKLKKLKPEVLEIARKKLAILNEEYLLAQRENKKLPIEKMEENCRLFYLCSFGKDVDIECRYYIRDKHKKQREDIISFFSQMGV